MADNETKAARELLAVLNSPEMPAYFARYELRRRQETLTDYRRWNKNDLRGRMRRREIRRLRTQGLDVLDIEYHIWESPLARRRKVAPMPQPRPWKIAR